MFFLIDFIIKNGIIDFSLAPLVLKFFLCILILKICLVILKFVFEIKIKNKQQMFF